MKELYNSGLLAGLWEFPNALTETTLVKDDYKSEALKYLKSVLNVTPTRTWRVNDVGEVLKIVNQIILI